MPSWVDKLIHEYTQSRRDLSRMKKGLNPEILADDKDLKLIDSMIRDMSESIAWMETGKDPVYMKGIHVDSVYHVRSYSNMDLIPDIAEQLKEESDINKKHLFMTPEEKVILADILASFSLRERQCYILHVGQEISMDRIADELGISKGSVQSYVERARAKVKERTA